jgi:hypothetical protein
MTPTPNFRSTFVSDPLTPLCEPGGRPNFQAVLRLQSELNANAVSVHSNRGTGLLGHLALTMPPDEFRITTRGTVFLAPTLPVAPAFLTRDQNDPDPDPLVVIVGPTISSSEAIHLYKTDLAEFNLYHDVDKALRSQLLQAVPAEFVAPLRHVSLGFATTTTLQLLTHLWLLFGKITMAEKTANAESIALPWDPTTSIEILLTRLTEASAFALFAKEYISEGALVRNGLKTIQNTGQYTLACHDWYQTTDESFDNFKAHFRAAEQTNLAMATTTTPSVYHDHHANLAHRQLSPIPGPNHAHYEIHNGMYGLPHAGRSATVTHEVVPPLLPSAFRANRVAQTPPHTYAKHVEVKLEEGALPLTYCFTHGYSANSRHTSATCKYPNADHQATATYPVGPKASTRYWTEADVKPKSQPRYPPRPPST